MSKDMSTSEQESIKQTSEKLLRIFVLLGLTIFLGTVSLLNFSLAFLIALIYVPVSVIAVQVVSNKLIKLAQLVLVVLASPIIYFSTLYMANLIFYENVNILDDFSNVVQSMGDRFYHLALMSKLSNIWTYDLVNLCLMPIWTSLWFIAFP